MEGGHGETEDEVQYVEVRVTYHRYPYPKYLFRSTSSNYVSTFVSMNM